MKRKKIGYFMAICITLVSLPPNLTAIPNVQASGKIALSKKQASITVKQKTSLKVKNATKKVVWKSSNKKIARIQSTSGKKKQKAVIIGRKKGKCTIIAKVGKRKLKCRLTVKGTSTGVVTPGAIGVYVKDVIEATQSSIVVDVGIFNGTKKGYAYGIGYYFQKYVNNEWQGVERTDELAFPGSAVILPAQSVHTRRCSLENTKEPLTSGRYRVYMDGISTEDCYAEFDVTIP